jgi:hypothetical protein
MGGRFAGPWNVQKVLPDEANGKSSLLENVNFGA